MRTVTTPHHRWVIIAETAINDYADHDLFVTGPITLNGGGADLVKVRTAELAEHPSGWNYRRPPAVTHLRPLAHLELWLKVSVGCRTPFQPRSPLRGVRVIIPLSGATAPAVFSTTTLFGNVGLPHRPRRC
jgi:hypothetical protein